MPSDPQLNSASFPHTGLTWSSDAAQNRQTTISFGMSNTQNEDMKHFGLRGVPR
jgi:hypothetical protein